MKIGTPVNPCLSTWKSLRTGRGCPWADSGFRRACLRGGGMANGWEADKRMDDSESLNPLIR